MKLDYDVVREILVEIERTPANQAPGRIVVSGVNEDVLVEHIQLLADRGLIEAKFMRSGMGGQRVATYHVERMTWAGHEFLADAKNRTVWEKAKALIVSKGGSASFEVMKAVLSQVALQHVLS